MTMGAGLNSSTTVSASDRLLIGVMVDVSGSMKAVLDLRNQAEKANVTRISKVFQIVSNVAHRAARPKDKIAVMAFGTQFVPMCDLLQLLEEVQELHSKERERVLRPFPGMNELQTRTSEMFCKSWKVAEPL